MLLFSGTVGLLTLHLVSSSRFTERRVTGDQSRVPFKQCREKSNATSADIEALRSRKMPNTKTGRCFLECIFETVKILKEGKFNKKGMVVVFSPPLAGDFSKLGKLRELSEVCEEEIGNDPIPDCEGATRVVKCVAIHGKDYGITFPKDRI